ncbi:MAG: hypothetical protein WDN44_11705 [Sphingomonas sp.]
MGADHRRDRPRRACAAGLDRRGRSRAHHACRSDHARRTSAAAPAGSEQRRERHSVHRDGKKLLVSHTGADTPYELYSVDLASGAVSPITHLAMASLSPEHLPKSRIVTFKSFDGTLISAVVTMPFNLARDGSNPAAVLPHGGPTARPTTASAAPRPRSPAAAMS